jgi:F-type H+-transporting ATPase subunit gamma
MVAASKLRKTQRDVQASRPYFEILAQTVENIAAAEESFTSPYLTLRPEGKTAFVVFAGDRGLAGGYNSNVLKAAMADMEGKATEVLPIGKRAVEFFRHHGVNLLSETYCNAEEMSLGDCFTAAKTLCKRYLTEDVDEIIVAYTDYVSVLSQVPRTMQLLPLKRPKAETFGSDIIYEPDCETVFATIIPEYLGGVLFGALCESRAAEQAARRTAMDNATQNADEMIANLSLQYNRARQTAITSEIIDIVAGGNL